MKRLGPIVIVCSLAAACSLPTDDHAQVIAQAELAPSLQTSSTTSTTTPPASETRDFAYFLLEPRAEAVDQRVVQQVPFTIPAGSLFEAIEPMEIDGFKDTIGAPPSLINAVNQYDLVALLVDDRTATVFLRTLGSEAPENNVLRDVAAQLVFTLTGDGTVDRVRFNIDDNPVSVPTSSEPVDRPVDIDDYATYNPEVVATTSTTPTGSTSTTVPPEDQ